MLVKISTEKINPTTGRVTVKYASNNENFMQIKVTNRTYEWLVSFEVMLYESLKFLSFSID